MLRILVNAGYYEICKFMIDESIESFQADTLMEVKILCLEFREKIHKLFLKAGNISSSIS